MPRNLFEAASTTTLREENRRLREELAQSQAAASKRTKRIRRMKVRLKRTKNVDSFDPHRIVWIFGSGRSGSTWLAKMMKTLPGHRLWTEPRVGALFHPTELARAKYPNRFLHPEHKKTWLKNVRDMVLDGAAVRFPTSTSTLVVKEPGGSVGAPVLVEALPESRMIFLLRDPRDVVASWLDAISEGSWAGAQRKGNLQPIGVGWKGQGRDTSDRDAMATERAWGYFENVWGAKRAFEIHRGSKSLIRYEELRDDALNVLRRVYSELGISVEEHHLAEAVKRRSWESIPKEEKGEGKFYRKATPGSWKGSLTPAQARIVEEITGELVAEFYP